MLVRSAGLDREPRRVYFHIWSKMRIRLVLVGLFLVGAALAARPWTEDEFRAHRDSYRPSWIPRPDGLVRGPRRYNYLERVKLDCDFIASYQVSDSASPDYGGIIEAEHMPTAIETDNTQEAIWVWSRWYELTGSDDYRENIRRAWVYVLNHPAYWEHGGQPTLLWYAVWNSGLALMVEPEYRRAYGDSTYLSYADSCAGFLLRNPLPDYGYRDNFVTGQSSGMAYDYALERENRPLGDSCLVRGGRVKTWIEAGARARLGWGDWAMSGGTAFWGVCRTVCREDTAAGKQWTATFAESLPGFYPTGNWNCSHNIWLANAYRAAAEVDHNEQWWLMHQYLTDTLLALDTDRDGGIPATWTEPSTRDQTWVSSYLDFMGMDVFVSPTYEHDVAALEFDSPRASGLYVAGDTIPVRPVVANVGLSVETFPLAVCGSGYEHSKQYTDFPFLGIDTAPGFPSFVADSADIWQLDAVTGATQDYNRANDTSRARFKVYGRYSFAGTLLDSATARPVTARLEARIKDAAAALDSTETDSTGHFSLTVLDTLIELSMVPDFPYYRRSWEFEVLGDTEVGLVTQPAHLLLVDNDTLEQYEDYYTSTLDTLGVSYHLWRRPSQGPPPYAGFDRLRSRALVWYSGDAHIGTVPQPDRDSIAALGVRGANLLLTGQNIAEEFSGTEFLEGTFGVDFDSSGWAGFFAFGNRADSLGRLIDATATVAGDGASNQISRDMLSPLRNGASVLMVYDTVASVGAAIRRTDPTSGARSIFLGFGFEAVNRPISMPGLLTRVQLMRRFLDWFDVPTGVKEPGTAPVHAPTVAVWPNPFVRECRIIAPPDVAVEVFDVLGRRVALLPAGRTSWRPGPGVRSGLYFIRPVFSGAAVSGRVCYLK